MRRLCAHRGDPGRLAAGALRMQGGRTGVAAEETGGLERGLDAVSTTRSLPARQQP